MGRGVCCSLHLCSHHSNMQQVPAWVTSDRWHADCCLALQVSGSLQSSSNDWWASSISLSAV